MFKSILRRLFWTYAIILLLVFTSLSVSVGIFVNRFAMRQHTDNIIKVSETIEYWTAATQIEDNNSRQKMGYLQLLRSWADFLNSDIIITNSNGEVVAATCRISTVPDNLVNAVMDGETLKRRSTFNGAYRDEVMVVGVPVRYQGTVVGAMFFNTGMFNIRKTALDLFSIFIISSAFSILAAAVLVYMQSRRITKPIGEINKAARDIASGKFDKRVAVTSADEIGQLASSFNFMADSIEELEKTRSEFISDVSHELRTPMTSISGFVEGMLDGTIPEERQAEYLKIVLDESKRLTKMVNDMLEMSKMSSSEYKLDISTFDLNELTRVCIINMGTRIDEKNLELNVDFKEDTLKVLADKDAIQRVIINLLDNAVKFSYPNTTIGVSAWKEGGKARFCIGNFGDGINGADLSNIFNRFYKTDKSRRNEKSGAGLGLSFVKNIITLHKQHVWVESVDTKEGSAAKYTKFTFTLELA
ncbi:MAG: HAMP domain-containing protein [Oscillospiraceae bacterium]|nr:HAMP domain-containing protein [Oscillospiraceae bacterium]